jgi:hypothetical protein
MAFGISKLQLQSWKDNVKAGEIAFLTHFWIDKRFPNEKSVTKVGCSDLNSLIRWGSKYGLKAEWVHDRVLYPHFDLIGERQRYIMKQEGRFNELKKFI